MPDSRLTDEMIEAAARVIWSAGTSESWDERLAQFPKSRDIAKARHTARAALTAVAPLLPDEAAFRAKIADEIEAERDMRYPTDMQLGWANARRYWTDAANHIRYRRPVARGSAAATEDSE